MVRPAGTPTAAQRRRLATAVRKRAQAEQRAEEAFLQELRAIHAEGVSIRKLAEELGHSTNTIQRWLKGE